MSDGSDYLVIIKDHIQHHFPYVGHDGIHSLIKDLTNTYGANNFILVKTTDWQAREAYRLRDGTYKALPDYFPSLPGHFVHVSRVNPSLIAYTENDTKGAKDIQTSCKPGRYLMKYFGDTIPGDNIQEITRLLSAGDKFKLKFATTRDEIRWAYENGPQSCMRQFEGRAPINDGIHAVEAYAAGDLAIAYLDNGNGEALSRVLCWPEKKTFLDSFYPRRGHNDYRFTEKLYKLLEDAGYNAGYLNGAKMLKIPYKQGFILPYLDDDYGLIDRGDYFTLDSDDYDFSSQCTGGIVHMRELTKCDNCNTRVDVDIYNFDDASFCESCFNELVSTCEHCENQVATEDITYLEHICMGLCDRCIRNQTTTCVTCENVFLVDDITPHNNENYCDSCLDDHKEHFDKDNPQCDECAQGQLELDSDAPVEPEPTIELTIEPAIGIAGTNPIRVLFDELFTSTLVGTQMRWIEESE